MKRPTMLTKTLVRERAKDLGLSAERDVQTIVHRIEHEGFSFLAITLPILCDALERGIEDGLFTCPSNFSRHGRLPKLLRGFFNRVFDEAGKLLDEPCPDAIKHLRQILRFWKKPKMKCSDELNSIATQRFKQVEDELRLLTPRIQREDNILDTVSAILWSQVFPEIDSNALVCCHGPGVTADRYRSNERYELREWYQRSELTFPPDLHAYHNLWEAAGFGWGGDGVRGLRIHQLNEEPGVRVVFVPKTLSGPRVIAIEPSAMQYMQQGLMRYVVPRLESHRLTAKSVHFSDQSINQSLAYQSSRDKRLATLDLKDASDRVHLHLVQRIFKRSGILEYLEDSRTLHADLPDGTNLVLNKFASMGSAMCFPVEAMVFYTLVLSGMHKALGWCPTSRSIRKLSRRIDIYGDDIIVPVEHADAVVCELESYGLKVNSHKSFRFSHFRESCGGDFFNGHDVKPVYAREYPHADRREWTASTVMSWVSTADQFYMAGWWEMAQCIREMLESVLRRRIPRSRVKTHGVGFASLIFDTDCHFRNDIQGWYQSRIVYTPSKRKDIIDGNATACLNRLLGTTRAPVRRGVYLGVLHRGVDPGTSGRELSSDEVQGSDSLFEATEEDSSADVGSYGPAAEEHSPFGLGFDFGKSCSIEHGTYSDPDLPVSGGTRSGKAPKPIRTRVTTINQAIKATLQISNSDIDLLSSVKRGAFKSKRRWVTVLT